MTSFQLKTLIGVLIIAVYATNEIITSQEKPHEKILRNLLAPLNRNLTERWRQENRRKLKCRDESIRVESSAIPKINETENSTVYVISQARVAHQSDNCDFYTYRGLCDVEVVVPKTVAKSPKLLKAELRINSTGVVIYHDCDFVFF